MKHIKRKAISPAELAKQLGVSTASILRACRAGNIHCVTFGKRLLIPVNEADRLLGPDFGDLWVE